MIEVVAIVPSGRPWSQNVTESLLSINSKDQRNDLHVSMARADAVRAYFDSGECTADIVIADLTESDPDAMIGAGITRALQRPMLLIAQHPKWLPSALEEEEIAVLYDPDDINSMSHLSTRLLCRLRDKIEVIKAHKIQESAQNSYLVRCYAKRTLLDLGAKFRGAMRRIDILTTNLAYLFEVPDGSSACLFDDIQKALRRDESRVRVRILTLDPESYFAAKRGSQLGYAPAVFRDQLREALIKTLGIQREYTTKLFETRVYDDFPNQITFRVDKHVVHCVVAQPTQSRNHLVFELETGQAGVDNSFINHFITVWRTGIRP